MVLLDWPPPDHLGIGRKRGNSCQRKHPAAILAVGSSYPPTVAAQTRIVSAAGIRLDHRKSVRPFKGRFCNNISEFESTCPATQSRLSGRARLLELSCDSNHRSDLGLSELPVPGQQRSRNPHGTTFA